MLKINSWMYLIVLVTTVLLMRLVDAWLTKHAVSGGRGSELNIFISTDSVASVFFSPVPFFISLFMILLLVFHRKIRVHIPAMLYGTRRGYYLVVIPYYYIVGMAIVLINNILISSGLGSIVGYFMRFVEIYFGGGERVKWVGLCLFFSIVFIVLDAAVKISLKKIYISRKG